MRKTPTTALVRAFAACLLLLAAVHFTARTLLPNAGLRMAAEISVSGVLFVLCLLGSRTLFRTRPALDYWLVAAAAIFSGAAMTIYSSTHDFMFVIAASVVTFIASLASLFRDLDERVKGSTLLFGYMSVCGLAYIFTAA